MTPPARPTARPRRVVVLTGTGTEVGKTWVAAEVVARLRTRRISVVARKPAQSHEPDDTGTDADVLAAATGEDPLVVCPPHRRYGIPMAPPMAADALGRPRIELAELTDELATGWPSSKEPVEVGLVELAGGVRSPMAEDGDGIALIAAVHPELVVLVADAGLGTIHAVRSSLDAIDTLGADRPPVVVVANRYDPGDDLHRRNVEQLTAMLDDPVVSDLDDLVAVVSGESGRATRHPTNSDR